MTHESSPSRSDGDRDLHRRVRRLEILVTVLALAVALSAGPAAGAPGAELDTGPEHATGVERYGGAIARGLPAGDTIATNDPARQDLEIRPGSGSFVVRGDDGYGEKRIRVFYHRPESLNRRSPVLLVVPGAGRNGDDYRDAWVEASEEHGVLILSPCYPEQYYPEFWSYNLAGMTSRVTLELTATVNTDPDAWHLEEADAALDSAGATQEVFGHTAFGMLARQMVAFDRAGMMDHVDVRSTGVEVNRDRADWIFDDFDRIFQMATRALDLDADGYDAFGHSAGGQVLHRMALFHSGGRARRILAANSGWYTVPTFDADFPYGLGDAPLSKEQLTRSFGTDLVVFLGELDNAEETRGQLRGGEAAEQGPGRLSRGRHFFEHARREARELGRELEWTLEVVPGVGHDFRQMSEAAVEYLYGAESPPPAKDTIRVHGLDAPVEIPMEEAGGFLLVPVTLHGAEGTRNVRLMLDTGSFFGTLLLPEIREELGELEAVAVGGAWFDVPGSGRHSRPDALRRLLRGAEDAAEDPAGPPVAGVMGWGLLSSLVVTLDVPGERLVLRRPDAGEPDPARGEAVATTEYRADRGNIWIPARVDGRRGFVHLDTGYSYTWVDGESADGDVESFVMGGRDLLPLMPRAELRRVEQDAYRSVDFDVIANLGTDALAGLVVTVDGPDRAVRFRRAEPAQ